VDWDPQAWSADGWHSLLEQRECTTPNPHWFGPPTGIPHRHHWKEEEAPDLHTGDNKRKA
jgi:hypothetical protein